MKLKNKGRAPQLPKRQKALVPGKKESGSSLESGANVLLIAGEESGDVLASTILGAWPKSQRPMFWGTGGDRLKEAGSDLLYHSHDLATFGLLEAAVNYRRLKKIIRHIAETAAQRKPEFAILVDFPDFNMILAKELSALNIPCYQVVSPTIWAWRYNRIKKIKKYISCVLCLYDFETQIYEKEKVRSFFMGHPLVGEHKLLLDSIRKNGNPIHKEFSGAVPKRKKVIALLPGSRKSEITRHAPLMANLAALYQDNPLLQFVVPAANQQIKEQLKDHHFPANVILSDYNAPYTLALSYAAVACSGTVTLECALWKVPFLIIYKTSWLTYNIGIRLLRIPWIGMVNILLNKMAFKEYKQKEITVEKMKAELDHILHDAAYYNRMKQDLQVAAQRLGKPGAAKKAAQFFVQEMKKLRQAK